MKLRFLLVVDYLLEEHAIVVEELDLIRVDSLKLMYHCLDSFIILRYLSTSLLENARINVLLQKLSPKAEGRVSCQVLQLHEPLIVPKS